MSIKKIALGFALAGIVGASSMLADADGFFVGGQLGYGRVTHKYHDFYSGTSRKTMAEYKDKLNGVRYGILGGYKQFLTDNFDLHYYLMLNLGSYNGVR